MQLVNYGKNYYFFITSFIRMIFTAYQLGEKIKGTGEVGWSVRKRRVLFDTAKEAVMWDVVKVSSHC